MKLSHEEAGLFFQIYFPLLDYTNNKYDINELDIIGCIQNEIGMPPMLLIEISNYLWNNISIIDEFLEDIKFPQEAVEILHDFKKRIKSRFIIERHLKKGSILINANTNDVYLVQGLFSTIEEMVAFTPMMIEATLIPFKGKIITDGLFNTYNVQFGSNTRSEFKEIYMNAKKNHLIIEHF